MKGKVGKTWLIAAVLAAMTGSAALAAEGGTIITKDKGYAGLCGHVGTDRTTLGDTDRTMVKKSKEVLTYTLGGKDYTFNTLEAQGIEITGVCGDQGSSVVPTDITINNTAEDGTNGTLYFNATSTASNSASGAHGIMMIDGTSLTINSDVNITAFADYAASGIEGALLGTTEGAASNLTINGNLTMRTDDDENPWAITSNNTHGNYGPGGAVADQAPNYTGARWQPCGIRIGKGYGTEVYLNGDVDIAARGTGISNDFFYGWLDHEDWENTLIEASKGTVRIETPESTTESYFAISGYSGLTNINVSEAEDSEAEGGTVTLTRGAANKNAEEYYAAGENKVTILGNIIVMKDSVTGYTKDEDGNDVPIESGDPYYYQKAKVNIGLTTADSSWEGVADNSGTEQAGELNLWLQNGATWTHRARSLTNGLQSENMPSPSNQNHYGTYDNISHIATLHGGTSEDAAGTIIQRDAAAIDIGYYTGHTNVYYAHENDGASASDYTAGSLTIESAGEESVITLVTDNTGIFTSNETQVNRVLNALASKLIYSAYADAEKKDNLTGYVKIADGLTASSQTLKTGKITFAESGAGSYEYTETPQKTEFTTVIAGLQEDEYKNAGVIQSDASADPQVYRFLENATITIAKGMYGISTGANSSAQKNITVNASGKTLTVDVTNSANGVYAINSSYKSALEITADKVIVNAKATESSSSTQTKKVAVGVRAQGATATINGDLEITAAGTSTSNTNYGIIAYYVKDSGVGSVTINGDLSLTQAEDYILNSKKYVVKGGGIQAKSGDSSVTVTGGGNIALNKADTNEFYAVGASYGQISLNVNEAKTAAGEKDLTITGNIGIGGASKIFGSTTAGTKATQIDIGLATENSSLTGIVYNAFTSNDTATKETDKGYVNLWLQNGASWTNEAYGKTNKNFAGSLVSSLTGGASAAKAGNIFQKDTNALTVDAFSGYANIFYEHANDGDEASDYAAGDTVIKKAAAGSAVTLVTDNSSIDMTDTSAVNAVLNALAGKLTYSEFVSGTENLTGTVRIAEGLTASSASLKTGDITFSETDGKGSYVAEIVESTSPITETTTLSYDRTAIGDEQNAQGSGSAKHASALYVGSSEEASKTNPMVVDMNGYDLTLKAEGADGIASAIVLGSSQNVEIRNKTEGKTLTISSTNKNDTRAANGIYIGGNYSHLTIDGPVVIDELYTKGDSVTGINIQGGGSSDASGSSSDVTVNGDLTVRNVTAEKARGDGINAAGIKTTADTAKVTVTGNVDITGIAGSGLYTVGADSEISVGGGTITAAEDAAHAKQYYAARVGKGTININMKDGAAGTNVTKLTGDLYATREYGTESTYYDSGSLVSYEDAGVLNVALTTADSFWTGANTYIIETTDRAGGGVKNLDAGTFNLWLQNGATWTNEVQSSTSDALATFAGSHAATLTGGESAAKAGNIFQKDSRKLTIDNYSGYTNIFYAHDNDGDDTADYAAGDTVIAKAAEGSAVSLITDNSGFTSSTSKTKVLDALAHKLVYSEYVDGVKNLTGEVKIASGLTASSETVQLGTITFTDDEGRGTYVVEQTATNFSTQITGVPSADTLYAEAGVLQDDGTYKFTKDSTVDYTKTSGNPPPGAIHNTGAITIDAEGKTLTVLAKSGAAGINAAQTGSNAVNIKADLLDIQATQSTSTQSAAIWLGKNYGTSVAAAVNIDGDVKLSSIRSVNTGNHYGIFAADDSTLTITGDLDMSGGTAGYGMQGGAAGSTYGIWAVPNTTSQKAPTIKIGGDLAISMQRGTAVSIQGGSVLDVAGGGSLKTSSSGTTSPYAIQSVAGTVNMNVVKDEEGKVSGAGTKDLTIDGNLGVMRETSSSAKYTNQKVGSIDLGLATAGSYLKGRAVNLYTDADIADGYTGEINLWLANGGTWTNEAYGTSVTAASHAAHLYGGADAASAGNIFQKDSQALTIDSYSGYTNIFYAHTNDGDEATDYAAGDTVIKTAAEGSVVQLVTDNTNVDMSTKQSAAKVLNALAGKLVYSDYVNGAKNLTGKVTIASGLTASSESLTTEDMSFTDAEGRGYYAYEVPSEFSQTITGVKEKDTLYVENGVWTEEGKYVFTKDSTISLQNSGAVDIAKDVGHAVDISAGEKTLTIKAENSANSTVSAIAANSTEGTTITAKKLVIDATSTKGRIEALNVGGQGQVNKDNANKLTVNGDVEMKVSGIGYSLGLYAAGNSEVTFNGNITATGDDESKWGLTSKNGAWGYYGCSLVYSGSNYTLQMGPKVTVNGDVNATIDGNGLFANGGHAKLTINGGGNIEINKDNTHNYYAMIAECGTTSMNVYLDDNYIATGARTNDLVLKGNVGVSTGAINVNEPEIYTYVNLGLATKDSAWTGVAFNAFGDEGKTTGDKTFYGAINLWLQNGATWNNELWGSVPKPYSGNAFSGSHLAKLTGGESEDVAGNIFMNDIVETEGDDGQKITTGRDLTIDSYSGYTNIFYAHTGDGAASSDYAAGDTIIRAAAEGSSVQLITDNTGITTSDETQVTNVLNALAGKLVYSEYVNGTKNLSGKVTIASGLTASAESLRTEDMSFTDAEGRGYYKLAEPEVLSTQITGVKERDTYYVKEGVLETEGLYKFTEDATISGNEELVLLAKDEYNEDGTIKTKGAPDTVTIDAAGHTLNFVMDAKREGKPDSTGADPGKIIAIDATTHTLNITADTININAYNKAGRVEGIGVKRPDTEAKTEDVGTEYTVNVKGDLNVISKSDAGGYALGLYTGGGAKITVDGNVTMKDADGGYGVTNGDSPINYYNVIGLYAGSVYSNNGYGGGHLVVNGDIDLKIQGNGIWANGDNSYVEVNGGGNIEVEKSSLREMYAIMVSSGYANLNVVKDEDGNVTGAGDRKVTIKGNIAAADKSVHYNEPNLSTVINVGLTTEDSEWTGVAYNAFGDDGVTTTNPSTGEKKTFTGEINLWLQNGATWNNEAWGMTVANGSYDGIGFNGSHLTTLAGGESADKAGNIYMKDYKQLEDDDGEPYKVYRDLTVDSYSGYTNVYYEHANDGDEASDYLGGDVIVRTAAKGSGIQLITDNANITMTDEDKVASTLNALAGKLVYSAYVEGEENLAGKVTIASGLTASSESLTTGDITYIKDSGRGSYVKADPKPDPGPDPTPDPGPDPEPKPEHQTKTSLTTPITGNEEKDTEYVESGIRKDDGTYKFEKDSDITIIGTDSAVIDAEDKVDIDADGSSLTLNGNAGIHAQEGQDVTSKTDGLIVNSEGGTALDADKDASITLESDTAKLTGAVENEGTIKIDAGNTEITGAIDNDGELTINAEKAKIDGTIDNDGTFNVDSDADITITGAVDNDGTLTFNTGKTAIDGALDNKGKVEIDADTADFKGGIDNDGTVLITAATEADVAGGIKNSDTLGIKADTAKIEGGIENSGLLSIEADKLTVEGDIANDDTLIIKATDSSSTVDSDITGSGETTLDLANGGKWTGNAGSATFDLSLGNGAEWDNKAGKTASSVTNLTGGTSESKAGNIYQNNAGKLAIDSYSGYTNIYYAHDGDGSAASNYAAGDTVIGKAAKGSGVTLITDNSGIDTKSQDSVENALSALAQKLYYMDAADNSGNLTGKVAIGSGLTASSYSKSFGGDMTYTTDKSASNYGQGIYTKGSLTPKIDSGKIETGDYETLMMKGVRSATLSSNLLWRNLATDIYHRNASMREIGEKDGIWAKVLGGRMVYDANNANFKTNYWGAQVGYDKILANGWNAGVGIDYIDGDSDYILSGKGDNTLYAFGIYASKDLGDGAYFDAAVKVGRIESDYSVYNELGTKLTGDYKTTGYSLAMQYGKRFGSEKSYIEPQVELTFARAGSKSYNAVSGSNTLHVDQDSYNSIVGRIGVEAGSLAAKGSFFGRVSLAHEFDGDIEAEYYAADGGAKRTSFDGKDTWAELTLGGRYQLSPASVLYADFTRSVGGDYENRWKLNAGLRFSF